MTIKHYTDNVSADDEHKAVYLSTMEKPILIPVDEEDNGAICLPAGHKWVCYKNGNYNVALSLTDGTKIRWTDADVFDAAFPESMDIKITNKCDRGCAWCHEDSKPDGKHALIPQPFMSTLRAGQEIAVGGGNVLSHPQLIEYLNILHDAGCAPSITLNQAHFIENIEKVRELRDKGLIYGIGISLVEANQELIDAAHQFDSAVIHMIAGILSENDVKMLAGNNLKVLILGYKDIRRGHVYKKSSAGAEVKKNMEWLADHLEEVFKAFRVVSFDNLALDQLPVREAVGEESWEQFYMGDDGQHTFYIDMVEHEFALSSTSQDRHPIGMLGIDEMFTEIKKRILHQARKRRGVCLWRLDLIDGCGDIRFSERKVLEHKWITPPAQR